MPTLTLTIQAISEIKQMTMFPAGGGHADIPRNLYLESSSARRGSYCNESGVFQLVISPATTYYERRENGDVKAI